MELGNGNPVRQQPIAIKAECWVDGNQAHYVNGNTGYVKRGQMRQGGGNGKKSERNLLEVNSSKVDDDP